MSQQVYGKSMVELAHDKLQHLDNLMVSPRSMGKSKYRGMMAQWAYTSADVSSVGDHNIVHTEKGAGVRYTCPDCDWEACYQTDGVSDEQCRALEAYVYGHALEHDCE